MSRMNFPFLPVLVRCGVAALLLAYGIEKMSGLSDFLKSIHSYGVLPTTPPWILNLAANGIPILEIAGGLFLLFGWCRRGTSAVVALFLLVFSVAIFMRTLDVMAETGQAFTEIAFDCGCGNGDVIIWQKLLFNAALLLGVLYVGFRPEKQRAISV
jgi:uncharacterized membrane protein YphA (DoxX/SURF4 family)